MHEENVIIAYRRREASRILDVLFKEQGYNSVLADTTDKCIEIALKAPKASLILFDHSMPLLDGRGAAMQLRSDAYTTNIPRIGNEHFPLEDGPVPFYLDDIITIGILGSLEGTEAFNRVIGKYIALKE